MNDQLAKPLTESERRTSRQALNQLHPGNRFRLMAGLPMLPAATLAPMEARKAAIRREAEDHKLPRRRYWWQETECPPPPKP